MAAVRTVASSHGLEYEEAGEHHPDGSSSLDTSAPAHDREKDVHHRPETHQPAIESYGANALLQRREEQDLERDGREAGDGECDTDVGLLEACSHHRRASAHGKKAGEMGTKLTEPADLDWRITEENDQSLPKGQSQCHSRSIIVLSKQGAAHIQRDGDQSQHGLSPEASISIERKAAQLAGERSHRRPTLH